MLVAIELFAAIGRIGHPLLMHLADFGGGWTRLAADGITYYGIGYLQPLRLADDIQLHDNQIVSALGKFVLQGCLPSRMIPEHVGCPSIGAATSVTQQFARRSKQTNSHGFPRQPITDGSELLDSPLRLRGRPCDNSMKT